MEQESTPVIRIRRAPRPEPDEASEQAGIAARRTALGILIRVDTERAFADVLLGARLPELRTPADRRLVTQLVLGTIAWRGRLDYELARLSSRPFSEIDPPILTLLRMGLYQLRMLTRVPAHAVVDTAVKLAREVTGNPGVAGFINAVLRAATRTVPVLPERSRGESEYLSLLYSHPRWLVEKFCSWFGTEQAETLMGANNEAAPNAIRLNLSRGPAPELIERLEREGMRVARRGFLPETVILDGAPLFDGPSYREGLFAVQAEASQIVARMLAPCAGSVVLDCAAAPGGKSAYLAELVGQAGRVIAVDRKQAGLRHARTTATRLQHRNIEFVRADLTAGLPFPPRSFSYILLDAPCSGLGTLREHPEIRWRLSPADLARMGRIQQKMLNNVAELVAPDGVLVYSVCSFAPEEGSQLVREFLTAHPDFRITPAVSQEERGSAAYSLAEQIDKTGFFAARLERR